MPVPPQAISKPSKASGIFFAREEQSQGLILCHLLLLSLALVLMAQSRSSNH
jgi:hypothetical protein